MEPYPVRALKTLAGGAVASYTTKLAIVAEQPNAITVLKAGGIDAALAGKTTFDSKITITMLDQWVVLIPPQNQGRVTILAHTGGKVNIS